MLERIFPREIGRRFPGFIVGLWVFVPIVILKLGIGVKSMLDARETAITADGIPLNTFNPAGAETAVVLFALLGLFQFLFGLLGVLALVRYRAMIPLLYLLFLVQMLANRTLHAVHPIPQAGGAGGSIVSLVLLSLTVVGLLLSLIPRSGRSTVAAAA